MLKLIRRQTLTLMSSFKRAAPAAAAAAAARRNDSSPNAGGGAFSHIAQPIFGPTTSAPFNLPGARRWIDGQWMVATGSMLDSFLGGGLPLGSLVLVEEDYLGAHAEVLTRLFCAEGAACDHHVVYASMEGRATQSAFFSTLPANVSRESKDVLAATRAADRAVDPADHRDGGARDGAAGASRMVKFGHTFDLNRCIHADTLSGASIRLVDAAPQTALDQRDFSPAARSPAEAFYAFLVPAVCAAANGSGGSTLSASTNAAASCRAAAAAATVSRVVIRGLGGPLWPGHTGRDPSGSSGRDPCGGDVLLAHRPMLRFLASLRGAVVVESDAAIRPIAPTDSTLTHSVVWVTMPTHALPPAVAAHVRSYFDVIFKVHAFSDPAFCLATHTAESGVSADPAASSSSAEVTGAAPEYADYHGLILLRRLPRAGGVLVSFRQAYSVLVFKRDRRKLTIEEPHLRPEGEESVGGTSSRNVGAASEAPSSSGGGGRQLNAKAVASGMSCGGGGEDGDHSF